VNGRVQAVVALALSHRGEQARTAVLQTLRWGGFWLELLIRERESAASQPLASLVGLMEKGLDRSTFKRLR